MPRILHYVKMLERITVLELALSQRLRQPAGSLQVRFPLGFEAPQREAERVPGCDWLMEEGHSHLGGQPVLLPGVAPAARRDDVLPGVLSTPGFGYHVVDVLGRAAAVLAHPAVPGEHGAARQRGSGAVGDMDEVAQLHPRRGRHTEALGSKDHAVGMYGVCLSLEHEDNCPAGRNHRQGLKRGIEDEGSTHFGP
jgi:hypothetical protein